MTVLSRPVCMSRPRDWLALPPHLEGYSPASHYQREIPIVNAVSSISFQDPVDAWGVEGHLTPGEDLTINIVGQDGCPSLEIALQRCPSRTMAKRIKHAGNAAMKYAAERALDSQNPEQFRKAAEQKLEAEKRKQAAAAMKKGEPAGSSKKKKDNRAYVCQVTSNVEETLDIIHKLMPGKRLSDRQMGDLAATIAKHNAAFAKNSRTTVGSLKSTASHTKL